MDSICQNILSILHLRPVLETPRSQLFNDTIICYILEAQRERYTRFLGGLYVRKSTLLVVHPAISLTTRTHRRERKRTKKSRTQTQLLQQNRNNEITRGNAKGRGNSMNISIISDFNKRQKVAQAPIKPEGCDL